MAVAIVAFTRMERLFMSELTQDEIIEMAREAGCVEDKHYKGEVIFISNDALERFAKLVAAKERERLAQEAHECGGVLTVGAILSKG